MQGRDYAAAPRRSLRRSSIVDYSKFYDPVGYPEHKPANTIEATFCRLNKQAFSCDRLSQLDDILTLTLFDTKKQPRRVRALHNYPSSGMQQLSNEEGKAMFHVLQKIVDKEDPSSEQCREAAFALIKEFGSRFVSTDIQILAHQLERYMLLYSRSSPIGLEKVSFDGKHISAGLRAKTRIQGLTYILHTSSSMSSDLWPGNGGHSVIESTVKQLGPKGNRLILGPFRFGNHDCNPNCQIKAIADSHAFAFFTLRDIEAGESLTVRYSKDGYFDSECLCATCRPELPPTAPRPVAKVVVGGGVKKHRAGRRRTRRAIEKSQETSESGAGGSVLDELTSEEAGVGKLVSAQ